MKVTREEAGFKKVTIVLETEEDVLNLYRMSCNGLYGDLEKKYEDMDVLSDIINFKGDLHRRLEADVPAEKRVF